MLIEAKSNAAKIISWPGATPFWACGSRPNPSGLRRSLPAMMNWLNFPQFVFCRVLRNQFLPKLSGNSCQNSLAVFAIFAQQSKQPRKELLCRCLNLPNPP